MTFTYKDVADIIRIIDASTCEEVVVELADLKIVVRRGGAMATSATLPATTPPRAAAPPAQAEPKLDLQANSAAAPADPEGGVIIRSPMTGTFYRASSPKDPPFVEIGSVVEAGDTLCSIEVMKLFTSVTAETAGRISRIFAANADLVQFDQPLFAIDVEN